MAVFQAMTTPLISTANVGYAINSMICRSTNAVVEDKLNFEESCPVPDPDCIYLCPHLKAASLDDEYNDEYITTQCFVGIHILKIKFFYRIFLAVMASLSCSP